MTDFKQSFMSIALEEAQRAARRLEVPVGAVVVRGGQVIARAGNRIIEKKDPTAHAEILALKLATKRLNTERLCDCDLYVTLEPCTMCAGAISLARVRRLYFGAEDEKTGAVENGVRFFSKSTCHHKPDVYSGLQATACAKLLTDFFHDQRQSKLP